MLERLLEEFNREQKIKFIRSVQCLYWTMSPFDTLREMDNERLDRFFTFMYNNLPSELLPKTVEMIRNEDTL